MLQYVYTCIIDSIRVMCSAVRACGALGYVATLVKPLDFTRRKFSGEMEMEAIVSLGKGGGFECVGMQGRGGLIGWMDG